MPAETLQGLENRLNKIGDLGSVVSTMKSLAAVNIRHFENASQAADGYFRHLENAFQILMLKRPENYTLPRAAWKQELLVLVGSHQGMVGRFNESAAGKAASLAGNLIERVGTDAFSLVCLGERMVPAIQGEGFTVRKTLPMAGNLDDAVETVRDIQEYLLSRSGKVAEIAVRVVYNNSAGGSSYETRARRILPLDSELLLGIQRRPYPGYGVPMLRDSWEDVFRTLTRQYLFITLFDAVVSSMASENSARLAAMQAAEKNIDEKEEEVRSLYNSRRQSSITDELLDIVGGFEALRE